MVTHPRERHLPSLPMPGASHAAEGEKNRMCAALQLGFPSIRSKQSQLLKMSSNISIGLLLFNKYLSGW